MKHPNTVILEKIYADLKNKDLKSVLAACDDKMTFQVSGKSAVAGKFDKTNFESGYISKLMELSGGTFNTEVHDILTSDLHGTVLASTSLMRGDKKIEYRTVFVWRFQNGKPVAWYEYPRDLYQYDSIWT